MVFPVIAVGRATVGSPACDDGLAGGNVFNQADTSACSAGATWYLNGSDSLGLSYEKEVKANGMTENKHYVSAGGQVFSLFVSRTGPLGTQTATTTSYFHHDHMGSVAAITDQTGAVTERLAYDPWGKRRHVNGNADATDSIVGIQTDRGYTMHEHLDEIGVIHMDARVYDPLIARFMSPDDVIPNPFDLKAFNRYSYVANNPLKYSDPTGNFWDALFGGTTDGGGGGGGGEDAWDPRDKFSRAGGWEVAYENRDEGSNWARNGPGQLSYAGDAFQDALRQYDSAASPNESLNPPTFPVAPSLENTEP